MKQILYFLLLLTLNFSATAQQFEENANTLINARLYSIDAENPTEPAKMWLTLPDSVKIFADNKLLVRYKHYVIGISGRINIEKQFLNAHFTLILPNKKTFSATAQRSNFNGNMRILNFYESIKCINSEGEAVEKITIGKPTRLSMNGNDFATEIILKKGKKFLYLVDNQIVNEDFIINADDDFARKIFQINAEDNDLISKFGERAKGFNTVFCIWTLK